MLGREKTRLSGLKSLCGFVRADFALIGGCTESPETSPLHGSSGTPTSHTADHHQIKTLNVRLFQFHLIISRPSYDDQNQKCIVQPNCHVEKTYHLSLLSDRLVPYLYQTLSSASCEHQLTQVVDRKIRHDELGLRAVDHCSSPAKWLKCGS